MVKVDCAINKAIASALLETYPWIIGAEADCTENYEIDDIMISAGTLVTYTGIPIEAKSIKGGWQIKYEGEWNPYFTKEIYKKLKPQGDFLKEGEPIYFINQYKYERLMKSKNACLVYAAPDGMLIYDHKSLREALLGYADYYVKHTTEFANAHRSWETKAILDMTKAKYLPYNFSKELFA